jgi:sugar phosphate isomerase/epimerase
MELSISNIAWSGEEDFNVYKLMEKYGFTGLEIAPTRFFPHNPYDYCKEAGKLVASIKNQYDLKVSSMQSILYGRNERIFESEQDRNSVIDYLFKAIDFAVAMGCGNLVFGSPKNRCIKDNNDYKKAVDFFEVVGNYAFHKGTVVSIEPNPQIYGTNFINTTAEAVKLVKDVDCKGFKLNLDIGTIIHNEEEIEAVFNFFDFINHIHISEPGLPAIIKRESHRELARILAELNYNKYISIEMKRNEATGLEAIEKAMEYISEVFAK